MTRDQIILAFGVAAMVASCGGVFEEEQQQMVEAEQVSKLEEITRAVPIYRLEVEHPVGTVTTYYCEAPFFDRQNGMVIFFERHQQRNMQVPLDRTIVKQLLEEEILRLDNPETINLLQALGNR